jgi:hypothetical protein
MSCVCAVYMNAGERKDTCQCFTKMAFLMERQFFKMPVFMEYHSLSGGLWTCLKTAHICSNLAW